MSTIFTPKDYKGPRTAPPTQFSNGVFPFVTKEPGEEGVSINNVTFAPGGRTFWHRHERGQILIVVSGRGRFQTEGQTPRVLRAGDTVWIPAGERHWHGSAPDSAMTHTAISMGTTSWEDAVSEADFMARAE